MRREGPLTADGMDVVRVGFKAEKTNPNEHSVPSSVLRTALFGANPAKLVTVTFVEGILKRIKAPIKIQNVQNVHIFTFLHICTDICLHLFTFVYILYILYNVYILYILYNEYSWTG